MKLKLKIPKSIKQAENIMMAAVLFLIIFLVYHFTGEEKTHFDYFIRLADAFLHQRLYLTQNPSWLNELVPVNGRYYVVYPPMAAILMLPWVWLWGLDFNQTLFSQILGALNAVLVFWLFRKLHYGHKISLLLALVLTLGTNHWFLASVGSAWYLGHLTAIFFLLLAFLAFFSRNYFLAGLSLGAAYWSRLPIILTFFYFAAWLFLKRKALPEFFQKLFFFGIGVFIFVVLNGVYNFVRFGTFLDKGYALIPHLLEEPWYTQGIFHLSYLPRNLAFFLTKMPVTSHQAPFLIPSLMGMAFWLTSPVFLFLVKANWRSQTNLLALANFILGILVVLTHGTVGFSQFGFRFSLDFVPLLLFPLAESLKNRFSWHFFLLLTLSLSINLWGTVLINKFNLWGW